MAKPNRKNISEATHEEAKNLYMEHGMSEEGATIIADSIMEDKATNEREELPPPPAVVEILMTAEELIKQYGNKSNAIRALSANGKTRSEVAKLLNIRYQHVNNVLGQVLKRPIKAAREAEKNGIVLEGDLPVAQSVDAVVKS